MKTMKQILASTLVAVMLVAGLMVTPLHVEAVDSVKGQNGEEYVLDTVNYNFANFWNEDASKRTAPTRDGYVFGGWYKDVEGTKQAITETEAKGITDASVVWAKFVPAEVLSIRAQLEKNTEVANGVDVASSYLRLLSGVNGLDYQKVGFDILYNKKTQDSDKNKEIATNITKVFSKITNTETGENGLEADTLFGEAATHFSVLRLDSIKAKNFGLVIYVTPQWTTLDGTLVKGQAKYVRVMDGYASNRYISVPINFIEGSAVAAGQIELKYDATKVQLVTTEGKGFDSGLIMPEMNYYDDGNGTIKIVGNVDNQTNIAPNSKIFANLWFELAEGVTEESLEGKILSFAIDDAKNQFCTWEEQWAEKAVIAEDVQYLK